MDMMEETIFRQMRESYEAKLRELPPPPPGYFYGITDYAIRQEEDKYIIDAEITLQPIISTK